MLVKKQQMEPYMEQLTGSKLGKEYDKAVYCHPVNLTCVKSTSCKMLGWVNQQTEIKTARRNINNLRYADDTNLMAESEEEQKSQLIKMKEETEKNWLKTQHLNNEVHSIKPLLFELSVKNFTLICEFIVNLFNNAINTTENIVQDA